MRIIIITVLSQAINLPVLGATEIVVNFPKSPDVDAFSATLASLKRGEKGVVEFIDTRDPLIQRLMTLGLVEGAVVQRSHAAIGGDPIEFRLQGLGISLRAEQASCFAISTSSPA